MSRWMLQTLDGTESYVFPFSPNKADSPLAEQTLAWFVDSSQGFTGVRAKRQPVAWNFSGALRSQEHYDALLLWSRKQEKIRVFTDLGEVLVVRLTGFQPDRTGATRRNVPWRHLYRMNAQVFDYQAGAAVLVGSKVGFSATAPAGVVLSNGANLLGARSSVTLTAPAGVVTGGAVLGVVSTLVVSAPAGSVSTGYVPGVMASVTVTAPAGLVTV